MAKRLIFGNWRIGIAGALLWLYGWFAGVAPAFSDPSKFHPAAAIVGFVVMAIGFFPF